MQTLTPRQKSIIPNLVKPRVAYVLEYLGQQNMSIGAESENLYFLLGHYQARMLDASRNPLLKLATIFDYFDPIPGKLAFCQENVIRPD
jgi:hypothetical protein